MGPIMGYGMFHVGKTMVNFKIDHQNDWEWQVYSTYKFTVMGMVNMALFYPHDMIIDTNNMICRVPSRTFLMTRTGDNRKCALATVAGA
jgi:hypothetical protein